MGGGPGAPLDTTTRVTLQGHAWVTPRSISAARSRRRRRGDAVVARELPKKNESGGAQRQTGDSGENSLEKTRKTHGEKTHLQPLQQWRELP